jgi:hypothetical protein
MNTQSPFMAASFLLMLGVLGGCALNPHPMDMTTAIQNAKTPADHAALAAHYEQAAKEADAQAESHRKILDAYQANPNLFREQHGHVYWLAECEALVKDYQHIADANRKLADLHRHLAEGRR